MSNYTANDVSRFTKRWMPLLEATDGVKALTNDTQKRNMAMLIQNQHQWFTENTSTWGGAASAFGAGAPGTDARDTYAPGDARLPKMVIPMIRRVFPELIANELVGVQAMSGPVGLAYALRFKYDGTQLGMDGLDGQSIVRGGATSGQNWSASGSELGYQKLDTRYTGQSAAELSGLSAGTEYVPGLSADAGAAAVATDMGIGALTSLFENSGRVPQVSLGVEKIAVEARTRKLGATYSVELEQDLKSMTGLDIDSELTNAMSYEIQAEVDREIIVRMLQVCYNAGAGVGWSIWTPATADGRWVAERSRDFYNRLIIESNKIAVRNRRGAANFVVVTPRVAAILQSLPEFTIAPVEGSVDTHQAGISKIGAIGPFKIYRDTRTEAQLQDVRTARLEYALLGYKGSVNHDTGLVFCPYIPVMVQRGQGPNDMNPRLMLSTRYGVVDNIFGAHLYYHVILVQGLSQLFDPLTHTAPASGNGGVMYF